jgi:hypothetical protein
VKVKQIAKDELEGKLRKYPNPFQTGVDYMTDSSEIFDVVTGKMIAMVKSEYFGGEKTYYILEEGCGMSREKNRAAVVEFASKYNREAIPQNDVVTEAKNHANRSNLRRHLRLLGYSFDNKQKLWVYNEETARKAEEERIACNESKRDKNNAIAEKLKRQREERKIAAAFGRLAFVNKNDIPASTIDEWIAVNGNKDMALDVLRTRGYVLTDGFYSRAQHPKPSDYQKATQKQVKVAQKDDCSFVDKKCGFSGAIDAANKILRERGEELHICDIPRIGTGYSLYVNGKYQKCFYNIVEALKHAGIDPQGQRHMSLGTHVTKGGWYD